MVSSVYLNSLLPFHLRTPLAGALLNSSPAGAGQITPGNLKGTTEHNLSPQISLEDWVALQERERRCGEKWPLSGCAESPSQPFALSVAGVSHL